MSYSYYLIHGLTLNSLFLVINRLLATPPSEVLFWLLLPIAFTLTLLPSALLFLTVERPFSLKPNTKVTAQPSSST
jgi:exopolysaccharide production protein ExoZ